MIKSAKLLKCFVCQKMSLYPRYCIKCFKFTCKECKVEEVESEHNDSDSENKKCDHSFIDITDLSTKNQDQAEGRYKHVFQYV